MATRKRPWLLNLLIAITVVVCILAFTAHYRNWVRLKEDRVQLLTGVYFLEVPYEALDTVFWVEKIPKLERRHGFSVWAREKGMFMDSLLPNRPVYVFVDDLRQYKLRVQYQDTLTLYLNFADSLETKNMYEFLLEKVRSAE